MMSIYTTFQRLRRGVYQLICYSLFEYPRGLDISLRSKSSGITLPGSRGYALTSKAALKNMLQDINLENKLFLDVGSGKGGAVIYARQLGCKRADGIEYEAFLHNIAMNNISILKLSSSCSSINIDARYFRSYGDYDIIFMFNPFENTIFQDVVLQIKSQFIEKSEKNERYLIIYGGLDSGFLQNDINFTLLRDEKCPYRGNTFRIFKFSYHG